MNRLQLQRLATERLDDASALLQAGRYSGAYYLAGYAVECALKACIARQTKEHDFPPRDAAKSYTHDLELLLGLAGLKPVLSERWSSNALLERSWQTVTQWSEESRYRIFGKKEAERLVEAVSNFENGILPCLRKDW